VQIELTAYLSVMIASIGITGAVIYYVYALRSQAQMRKTDLIMRIYSTFMSKDIAEADAKVQELDVKDYHEFKKKYGPYLGTNPTAMAVRTVAAFFEALGILYSRKLIPMDLVYDLFSIEFRWRRLGPILRGAREDLSEPEIGRNLELLYEAEKVFEKSRGRT
jgi:hypothetical protein